MSKPAHTWRSLTALSIARVYFQWWRENTVSANLFPTSFHVISSHTCCYPCVRVCDKNSMKGPFQNRVMYADLADAKPISSTCVPLTKWPCAVRYLWEKCSGVRRWDRCGWTIELAGRQAFPPLCSLRLWTTEKKREAESRKFFNQ